MLLPLSQEGQIFPEADFITIHLVGIQPDTVLGQLGIIKLGPESVGVVVDSFAAEQKGASWDGDHGGRLSQRSDGGKMAG